MIMVIDPGPCGNAFSTLNLYVDRPRAQLKPSPLLDAFVDSANVHGHAKFQ